MQRVVIIKMWAIGDVVLATPMLSALRARYPDVKVTWVVDESHGDILKGHPGIDNLEIIHSGLWRRKWRHLNYVGWLRESLRLKHLIQSYNPDAVINCHADKWWTIFLCPAPQRVALYPTPRLPWSARWYTHPLPNLQPAIHVTRQYLMATQVLGCPEGDLQMTLGQTDDEAPFVADFEREHGLRPGEPFVLFVPFTTARNKNWPGEHYAVLADSLTAETGQKIVLVGGPKDADAAQKIRAQARVPLIWAGRTTLRQYLALIRRAALVVSGDTSALHIAAALGTPFVTLFGPTSPRYLAPLVTRGAGGTVLETSLPCRPCYTNGCTRPIFAECLYRIAPEEVAVAARPYLKSLTTLNR